MEVTVSKKLIVVLVAVAVIAVLIVGAIVLPALNSAGKPIVLTATPALETESINLAKPELVSRKTEHGQFSWHADFNIKGELHET